MKKVIVLCVALVMTGCSQSGSIKFSDFEYFKDMCNNNGGVSLFYFEELNRESHVEEIIVGVKCNDGFMIKEDYRDSLQRIDVKDR